jgi:glutathione S-transferase
LEIQIFGKNMITLHYHPGNASLAVHLLLRELGANFQLQYVDRAVNAHKSAAYLALNPNGLIPVLQDGDLVLYETAAILMHLADTHPATHPAANLAPPLGTAQRAQYYKWMVWLTNTMQARLMHYFYPDRLVDEGNTQGAAQVKAHSQTRVGECLAQLGAQLQSSGGPWLLGQHYSAVDPLALMLCRWTRGFDPQQGPAPARDWPALQPYLARHLERPAVMQTFAAEALSAPWV